MAVHRQSAGNNESHHPHQLPGRHDTLTITNLHAVLQNSLLYQHEIYILILDDNPIFARLQKAVAVSIDKTEVTPRVYLEAEYAAFTGFYQALFKEFQFFYRAGNGAIRVAYEPVNRLHSVHIACISHRHLRYDFSRSRNAVTRQSDRRIRELTVAQAVCKLVHRITRDVFVKALSAPSAAVAAVIINRNLTCRIREGDRQLS